jgi:hypothetical protein
VKEQFASWGESRLLRYLNIAGVVVNNTNENDIVYDPQSCNSEEHFLQNESFAQPRLLVINAK